MDRQRGVAAEPGIRTLTIGALLVAAILAVGGWFFVSLVARLGEDLERRALMELAATAAASLEPAAVASLDGRPDDLARPAFAQVRETLERIRNSVPGARFAYLVRAAAEDVVFLADAEPPDSADYSPPGQVYEEASEIMHGVLRTGEPAVEGPLRDRWGTWVSGLAPVVDPHDGEVVAVFGLDVGAEDWEAGVWRYRWFAIAVAGLVALVVASAVVLAILHHRFRVRLAIANRIAENSGAILYRCAAAPGFPVTFISGNISRLGYRPSDFIGSANISTLIHPDDLPAVADLQGRIGSGGTGETARYRLRGSDGTYRWFDNRVIPIRDEAGRLTAVEGFLVDITESKQAEDKIREDESIIRGLVEQGIFAVFVVGEDGRLVYVNPMFAGLLGYEAPADYLGRPLVEFVAEGDRPAVAAAIGSLVSGAGGSADVAAAVVARSGTTADILAQATFATFQGQPAIIGVAIDVTERKRAEARLGESEAALAEAQAIAHVGSWQFDIATRRVVWSRELYRIFGVDPARFIPTYERHFERVHPEDRDALENAYLAALANREAFDIVKRIVREDGQVRHIHYRGHIVQDTDGNPVRATGTAQDITEIKTAEQRIVFANTLLTTAMENSPDGILVVGSGGGIVSFNRRFAAMWGIPLDMLIDGNDEPVLQVVTSAAKHPEQFLARVRYLYDHPEEPGHDEIETRDGRFIDRHSASLHSASGEYLGRIWYFRDITDRRRAVEALRASEERLRAVFSSVSDAILVTNLDTAFIDVNPAGCAMFGYTRSDLIGSNMIALSSNAGPYTEAAATALVHKARTEGPQTFEWQCRRKDGSLFFAEIAIRCTTFGGTEVLLATLRDITERRSAEAEILRLARHDMLTGLANRGVFMEAVRGAAARSRRGDPGFAVLFIDLDHFKDVNDTLGHPVGDRLLKAVAARLRSSVREVDSVARFGGDEFAVLLAEIRGPADAATVAEELVRVLHQPYSIEGNDIAGGASIGVALFEPDGADGETLLSQADVALYRAKSEGRGTYRFFTEVMDTEVRTRVTLGKELRDAIASDQLFLLYQPQLQIPSGRITGVEALARWRHPERGILKPSVFIPVAETSGLIVALGRWALLAACRQAKAWLDAGIAPARIAVNISGMQFRRPLELERDIGAILSETGLPPSCLELELTETVLMEVSREHSEVLVRLHQDGVQLAIDDFGTGFSSLDYLRRFPADRIKIAQDFVHSIPTAAGSAAIVRATIGLAHELGIAVLAEGVETEAQLDLLTSWGCREVQGFLFSRPIPAEELEPHLRNGRIEPRVLQEARGVGTG